MSNILLMKTTTTRLYKVVGNGTETTALPLAMANRIAKAVSGGKGGKKPVAVQVVPA